MCVAPGGASLTASPDVSPMRLRNTERPVNSAEYIAVLVSIVIGLALADLLASLHRLLRAGRRVRWDWAAPLAAILVVMTLVMLWWAFYQPSAEPVSIGEFLPDFVTLVLLFLLAGAALPDEVPPEGLSLRTYYDRNGPYFWSLFSATLRLAPPHGDRRRAHREPTSAPASRIQPDRSRHPGGVRFTCLRPPPMVARGRLPDPRERPDRLDLAKPGLSSRTPDCCEMGRRALSCGPRRSS